MTAKAVVIFSGGQDSTTCLLKAIKDLGRENIVALTFEYGQKHQLELERAGSICADLQVAQKIVRLPELKELTTNALLDKKQVIEAGAEGVPNTFVAGRNALFLLEAAIFAYSQQISRLIIGVNQVDFSGYPDCRGEFIEAMNRTLNLAMDYEFDIMTPLLDLSKAEIWALADELGYLAYVEEHTHTCYEGIPGGCGKCPSCLLRNEGLKTYLRQKNKKQNKVPLTDK